jgi:hypothetical protein
MGCVADQIDQVPLDDFVPYCAAYLKGAPDDLIAHNVRLSAIQFVSTTMALERTLYVDAQANVHDYCLDTEDLCVNVRSVASVCMDNRYLQPLAYPPCDECRVSPVGSCTSGCRSYGRFWLQDNKDLLIWPAPHCDGDRAIRVRVKTIPGQDCCFLPRFLYDQFAEEISDGAIYRMLMMKGAAWHDSALAGVFLKKHASGVSHAKTLVARRFNTSPVKLAYRKWA